MKGSILCTEVGHDWGKISHEYLFILFRVSTVNLFRDPAGKGARSAINIAWHPDGGKHAAVSYGSVGFQAPVIDAYT